MSGSGRQRLVGYRWDDQRNEYLPVDTPRAPGATRWAIHYSRLGPDHRDHFVLWFDHCEKAEAVSAMCERFFQYGAQAKQDQIKRALGL